MINPFRMLIRVIQQANVALLQCYDLSALSNKTDGWAVPSTSRIADIVMWEDVTQTNIQVLVRLNVHGFIVMVPDSSVQRRDAAPLRCAHSPGRMFR